MGSRVFGCGREGLGSKYSISLTYVAPLNMGHQIVGLQARCVRNSRFVRLREAAHCVAICQPKKKKKRWYCIDNLPLFQNKISSWFLPYYPIPTWFWIDYRHMIYINGMVFFCCQMRNFPPIILVWRHPRSYSILSCYISFMENIKMIGCL